MTVSASLARKVISGAGWSNPLTFAIYIESSSHIEVWADDALLALGTDYTVDGVADPAGFEVTIVSPATYDDVETWVLLHKPPLTQGADISAGGSFGLVYENAIDAITRRLQAVDERAQRALKLPLTSPGTEDFEDRVPIGDASGTFIPGPTAANIANVETIAAEAAASAAAALVAENNAEAALAAVIALAPAQYPATRDALAAVDTVLYDVAYLKEAGREGMFKRQSAAAYTGWAAVDTTRAVVVPSTHNAAYSWVRVVDAQLNAKWFGAVADGAYDAGLEGYAGTDNIAPFQAAMDLGTLMGLPVYAPTGSYRFARQTGSNNIYLTVPNTCDLIGDGIGRTVLLIDHDHTENTGGNKDDWFFGSATANGALSETLDYERFTIKGLTVRGLWDYWPGDHRVHVFRIRNFEAVVQANMRIESISGNASHSEWNGSWTAFNCEFARIATGAIKSRSTPKQLVSLCLFEHIDDDVIDSHLLSSTNVNEPVKTGITITSCQFIDCEGILILGGSNIVVADNVFQRMKSAAIVVSCQTAETGEGAGTNRNVQIANNLIEDTLFRANTSAGSDLTPTLPVAWQTGNAYHIQIGGGRSNAATLAAAPGAFNAVSGAFIRPYDTAGSLKAGFMHVIDTIDEGADPTVTPGYGSSGFIVTGNICRRTLPSGAAYSSWGFGENFTRFGWVDLTVTEAVFANRGIGIVSEMRDARIEGNVVSGCLAGFGIGFIEQNVDREYERVVISRNLIKDCQYGIGRNTANPANTRDWGVEISDNLIDCDPYHQQTGRASPISGAWSDPGATLTGCVGIYLYRAAGLRVLRNRIANCQRPWVVAGNTDWYTTCFFEANELRADFAAENWSASNKGIGMFLRGPDASIRVATYDCDPTSANYSKMLVPPVLAATAMPTSGFFFRGQFVRMMNPAYNTVNDTAIVGFLRLTTNNTSWAEAAGGVDGDWETVVSRAA